MSETDEMEVEVEAKPIVKTMVKKGQIIRRPPSPATPRKELDTKVDISNDKMTICVGIKVGERDSEATKRIRVMEAKTKANQVMDVAMKTIRDFGNKATVNPVAAAAVGKVVVEVVFSPALTDKQVAALKG